MESSPPLAEDPQSAISEIGFFVVHDQLLGQNVRRMDDDATPFASAGGLLFCRANVLDNPVSQSCCFARLSSNLTAHSTDPRILLRVPCVGSLQIYRH